MKQRVLFVQTNLKMGGISKSLINLLNAQCMKEYEIDLMLLDKGNDFGSVDFPQNVNIIYFETKKWKMRLLRVIPFKVSIDSVFSRYDFVIDFNGYSNICANIAININAKKHFIWIHNDYYKKYIYSTKFKILWKLMKWKYKYYDEVIAVSEGAANGFRKKYACENVNIHIIPNIINSNEVIEKSKQKIGIELKNTYNMISVGNLVKAKNIEKQIDVIDEVRKKREDICLYILGDGKEKKILMSKVKRKKLTDNIFFLGKKENPYPYMEKMDGLIFTSLYEGQGIVVREAQILGLDLYIDEGLKDYNEGIETCFDMVEKIVNAKKKKEKQNNMLENYHDEIDFEIKKLFQ